VQTGKWGKTILVDSADRRGKDFLGTVQTVGEQPIMGAVEKIKWKNTPLWAQCKCERGTSVLWGGADMKGGKSSF